MIAATDFGEDFSWGVTSSAYQTEGAYSVDGKGLSIWDVFTRNNPKAKGSGNIACNFYNRYMQDIILMEYMNIRHFRFSISWSRIMPEGTGRVNEKGIEFYNRLIDFCLEMGIQPWITLYHWDLPYALELHGGWTNRKIIDWFADYVRLCVKRFGDRVKHWMVLNEPLVFTGAGYFLGLHAPGKKGLKHFLPAVHHAVLCQAIGARIIQSEKGLQTGTTFSCAPIFSLTTNPNDIEAAQKTDVITNRLFIEPLLGLGYPTGDLKQLQQLEQYIEPEDDALMKCDMDFIGLQNFTREVVRFNRFTPYLHAQVIKASQRNVYHTDMDWEVYPQGMYEMVKRFSSYEGVKKLVVTENGASFPDYDANGKIVDTQRLQYIQEYLKALFQAKAEGAPVTGYFARSFTDNFEWIEGYDKCYGLVHVDHITQRRTIKASGHWYRSFILQNIEKAIHHKIAV